jgi:hypothetical protein
MFPLFSHAIVLEWDRNAETNVAGYRAYYGRASRGYSAAVDAGNQVTASVDGLIPGKTYYFAVTAYTADGLESDFSDEVSYSVPTAAVGSPCVGCFSALDDFLAANADSFPRVLAARLAMSTNSSCLEAGLATLGAVTKAAGRNTNSELAATLASVAQCLAVNLKSEIIIDRDINDALLPSRWSSAASNQISRMQALLDRSNLQTNASLQSRSFTSVGKMLTRATGLIASGNLAPVSLSNQAALFVLISGHDKTSQMLQFHETSVTTTNAAGEIQIGTYVYQRNAWNLGTLTLTFDGNAPETLTIVFGRRWRVTGPAIRGFALPQ